jgi:hypothetical protein
VPAGGAAGATHKVLLPHFDGGGDLLRQAILQLRERGIGNAVAAAPRGPARRALAARVRAMWPILMGERSRSAGAQSGIGLAVYDPTGRYAEPGREASQQYLPPLLSNCLEHWSGQRKLEVAETILAVLRGSWCTG